MGPPGVVGGPAPQPMAGTEPLRHCPCLPQTCWLNSASGSRRPCTPTWRKPGRRPPTADPMMLAAGLRTGLGPQWVTAACFGHSHPGLPGNPCSSGPDSGHGLRPPGSLSQGWLFERLYYGTDDGYLTTGALCKRAPWATFVLCGRQGWRAEPRRPPYSTQGPGLLTLSCRGGVGRDVSPEVGPPCCNKSQCRSLVRPSELESGVVRVRPPYTRVWKLTSGRPPTCPCWPPGTGSRRGGSVPLTSTWVFLLAQIGLC